MAYGHGGFARTIAEASCSAGTTEPEDTSAGSQATLGSVRSVCSISKGTLHSNCSTQIQRFRV